ncbi:MAG TPA: hypothetical protein VMS73_05390 [Anaerolineaceae bacterium]|nr:hypothetical protein [Anaerolineaceae bacterium]
MENETLTHRQRIEKVVGNQVPDRIPVVLWRHFPVDDQTPEGLAAATASYQSVQSLWANMVHLHG